MIRQGSLSTPHRPARSPQDVSAVLEKMCVRSARADKARAQEQRQLRRRVRIIGAQVEGVDAMARALQGDHSLREPAMTLADGVRVKQPGRLTERILAELLDDVIIVREAELRETLVRLALEEHVIAEGAGR